MLKIIPVILFSLFNVAIQAQSISSRVVDDSTGCILITTNSFVLSESSNACTVIGEIFNTDSINYFSFTFYFKAPHTFFLTQKDKIYIRFIDGEVYEESPYTEGVFYSEGDEVKTLVHISNKILNKMLRQKVTSISLINESFRHTINIKEQHIKSFKNLAEYLLSINVYDENGIKWSELTEMKFPEN